MNAQRDDRILHGEFAGRDQHALEPLSIRDVVIRRQHGDHGIGHPLLNMHRRQPYRRTVVANERLDNEVPGRDVGRAAAQFVHLIAPSDDKYPLRGQQRLQPVYRHLEHRPLLDQWQHLFGAALAAERPQPGPATAGRNQGV